MNVIVKSAVAASIVATSAGIEDPVFATIERHKVASQRADELLERLDLLEDSLPGDKRTWSSNIREHVPPEGCEDDPEWIRTEMEYDKASTEKALTSVQVVHTAPTTVAGLAALLTHAVRRNNEGSFDYTFSGFDQDGEPEYCNMKETLIETLARSLDALA